MGAIKKMVGLPWLEQGLFALSEQRVNQLHHKPIIKMAKSFCIKLLYYF